MNIAIIGSGATGLSLAYLLSTGGHKVTIYESASIPGGLLNTFEAAENTRLEYYYHHFFTHDAEINWLIKDLGLSDKLFFKKTSMGIYSNEKLYPFNSAFDLLKFREIPFWSRLRFGISSLMLARISKYKNQESLPAIDWFKKYAGQNATKAIWNPMLTCKFGEAANELPLSWMHGRMKQRVSSRKRGVEMLGYLKGSLQVLVDTLVQKLNQNKVELHCNKKIDKIIVKNNKAVGVFLDGTEAHYDTVVSTVPTIYFQKMIEGHNPDYSKKLSEIQYLGAQCVVLKMKQQLSPFYWLNVADNDFDFGGVIEHTNFLNPKDYGGSHIVYLSKYLTTDNPLWTMPQENLIDRQISQLEKLFKKPVREHVLNSWLFRARTAAPLVGLNYSKKIPDFQTPIDNLYAASMCHIYPDERSVNNSIRVAAELASTMGFPELADTVPKGSSLSDSYGHTPVAHRK